MIDLYYRGILTKDHSWGVVATELCLALEKKGFNIKMCDPIHKDVWDSKRLDPRIENKLSRDTKCDLTLSYCIPPNIKALPKGNIAHIYNYEFTQIPAGWANMINSEVKLFLPSSEFAKELFVKNGVDASKTEVLPHGIDLTKYNPQIPALDLNSKKFTFLCVSAPHYRKGLDVLLKAFGQEFATIEEVELVIKTQIPKKRNSYEIDIRKVLDEARRTVALPRVRVVTEYYPSLAPLYRAAHAYVSPTHSECFGLTELEAVCCGLPVIVTNYGGYLDFLNKNNAFLVNQQLMHAPRQMQYWHYSPKSMCANPDVNHLRQQMRYVFNNYKVAQQKAKQAYEQIAPKYTWDKVSDRFIELAERYNLIEKGLAKTQRKVPVGILIPESNPSPNRAKEQATTENVEALRKSLKRKAKQAVPNSLSQRSDPDQIKISSYTLVYNEEQNITGLLENIGTTFDEIVLVDGGSKDNTVRLVNEFIRKHNVNHIKLLVKPQRDSVRYSPKWNQAEQRNFALDNCSGDWIFMIDADERLDSRFKDEIKKLAASGRSKAYAFPRYNYWESKEKVRIDGWWYPNYGYRLWKNFEGIKYENKPRHCQPMVAKFGLPNVLTTAEVKNFGPFSDLHIHHLNYLTLKKNELGLYRANDRDAKTVKQLAVGLKTKLVMSLDKVLKIGLKGELETRPATDNQGLIEGAPNVAFVMENFSFYSGGRYHLYQEAWALAKAGANVWMITNQAPVYMNDFPKVSNFRILEKWKLPPGVRFSFVVGTPSTCAQRAYNISKTNKAKLALVSLETPNFIREYRGGKDSTEEYWSRHKSYMKYADIVLASAKLPAKYLKMWAKIPSEKIEIMPPAVNEHAVRKTGKIRKANTLVFVSRLVEHKKLDNLLEAVSRLQKSVKDAPALNIIGNGRPEEVQNMLRKRGINGQLFVNISDVAKFQLIKRSKGLITCSTYEGFGMSPLEGMICEVPVFCSDLPIFHETLGDRVTYFKIDDVEMLTNQLKSLFTRPEIYASKVQRGKQWVEEQYTLAAMSNRWKKVISHLFKKDPEVNFLEKSSVNKPKFSVCMIALNEEEYIGYNLKQLYDWDCCHEIIIVEGSVELYPKSNLSEDGLSGDKTTEIIKNFPDPQNKIKYITGKFKNKIEQRNEYAKRVTGTHVLVVDADEFYSQESLEQLADEASNNPDVELFTFNFSQNPSKRTYYHLWYNFQDHVVGGYWDIPHNRIYKWTEGTRYTGSDHNHPTKPDGTKLVKYNVKTIDTKAVCVHTGFVKKVENQKDKNDFYVNRGEGKEQDPKIRQRRQMYVDCRRAYETWKLNDSLPHGAKILPFTKPLPDSLLDHPYMQDPRYLLKLRERDT